MLKMKLDLGAGQNVTPGYEGVDYQPGEGIDHVVDLFAGKRWPFKTSSVEAVVANHLIEHIPHYRPEYKGKDGWWVFFDELHRICKPDAQVLLTFPQAQNARAFWDPTHTRYIVPTTMNYLDKTWRESQKLDHYSGTCDFEIVVMNSAIADSLVNRHHEAQQFGRNHYWDALGDLYVELRARK
jgi:predicted SAM-dependent methyltransferase